MLYWILLCFLPALKVSGLFLAKVCREQTFFAVRFQFSVMIRRIIRKMFHVDSSVIGFCCTFVGLCGVGRHLQKTLCSLHWPNHSYQFVANLVRNSRWMLRERHGENCGIWTSNRPSKNRSWKVEYELRTFSSIFDRGLPWYIEFSKQRRPNTQLSGTKEFVNTEWNITKSNVFRSPK